MDHDPAPSNLPVSKDWGRNGELKSSVQQWSGKVVLPRCNPCQRVGLGDWWVSFDSCMPLIR